MKFPWSSTAPAAAAASLAAALCLAPALPAAAQPVLPADVAVPFYTPVHALEALYRLHYQPRAQAFAQASAALVPALQAGCAPGATLEGPRTAWREALLAWARLAAVQLGPLVERRSLRRLDFQPARPELISRAVKAAPTDAAGMARVGTPAKGLPALEYLLWTRPAAPGSAECRFAQAVAADLAQEAATLATDFQALAAQEFDDDGEAASAAFGEFINQWLGGIERLRWADIGKPIQSADGRRPAFAREASGSTAAAWQARWQVLRQLTAGPARPLGDGLVPVEAYLRGRGQNPLADALAAQVATTTEAFGRLGSGSQAPQPEAAQAAARALAALKSMIEKQVAPALEVALGFTDADGD